MTPPVLLTGATGFVGMEVLAQLLEREDREVVCLIRAADQAGADARLEGVLSALWRDPSAHRPQVRAVAGELTQPGLGLGGDERTALAEQVGSVLHCAASIAFDLSLEDARAVNVDGTREVLAFCREARALGRFGRYVHVSTAYVAGRHEGTFFEHHLQEGQAFRNTYERTKWEAEHLVAEASDLAPVIARPSIVMGESSSGWTPAFNVLYWPLRAFGRGLFDTIPARPEARVDIVPVDYVAEGLVRLLDDATDGVINLVAGAEAPTMEELIALASAHFGRERPPFVEPGSIGTGSAAADDHGAVYFPYFDMDVVFDDARARAALEPAGLRPPRIGDYFATLMGYAEEAKWGKAPLTREEARERATAVPA
jgi:thioester reductase-like protein